MIKAMQYVQMITITLGEFCFSQSNFGLFFRKQAQDVGGLLFYIIDIFINACETEIMLIKYLNFILSIERHFKYWERL